MGLLNQLFGGSRNGCADVNDANSVVIDVRTPREFNGGNVHGSINIPLDILTHHIADLKNEGKPVILCCASGARSGRATSMLKSHGVEACNGGSWISVQTAKQN